MKILLTGSTSYLGSKFVEMFQSRFEILGVSRTDEQHPLDLLNYDRLQRTYVQFGPDVVIHTAADVRAKDVEPNVVATNNLLSLAQLNNTPFIFSSSEAIYGGREHTGGYVEADPFKPRSIYAESKVESERAILASGLPYLITRCHRYVGVSMHFQGRKQFPDTLRSLANGETVHADSRKFFRPCLINHISEVYVHHIAHNLNQRVTINLGSERVTTYYDFVFDVATALELNAAMVMPDGDETSWPENASLSIDLMERLGYPRLSYVDLLDTIRTDWKIGLQT